jgi:uncharacterized RmlC-like cupin family protein
MIPTLPTLATICRVYGVGMSHFFAEPEKHTLSITRKAHLQVTSRGVESVSSIPLNAPKSSSALMAEMVEILAAGADTLSDAYQRETSGLVYVIEGSLHLDAGGLHEVLEAGDCIFIESTMPLMWSAGAKERCRVLAVRPARNGR